MDKSIFSKFEFSDSYKEELIEYFKHLTNAELGGYRIFDGTRTHMLQNPYELSDFIFALKKYEKDSAQKLNSFLEIGFSAGINNTIMNKFFNFNHISVVDNLSDERNGLTFKANMMHKNLTMICGDSTSDRSIEQAKKLGPYDFIFIDANHDYEYAKKDFFNYKPFLTKGGVIGFHDVDNPDHPGVLDFWNELKETGDYEQKAFVCRGYPLQYGIGMLTLK
tara:strand:+ start:741 stop:1403 length:663 start_codon:yes stop_codon:yes gene_type:complete